MTEKKKLSLDIEPDFNERCYPDLSSKRVVADHLAAYEFAKDFIKGKKVLDIACGEGYGSDILKKAGASDVYGVDNNSDILARAAKKYPEINFSQREAVHTGFDNNFFDIIISFATWHHLDEYQKFPAEMSRILKPEGIFILSVPNKRIIYLNPFHRGFLTKYYRFDFSKKDVEKMIRPYFEVTKWYGQRFVKRIYLNPIVKLLLLGGSYLNSPFKKRVSNAFTLGDGPAAKPLLHDNARYMIAVCRKIK